MPRPARSFFIPEVCGLLRVMGHVDMPELTWQRWSPPEQGGGVRSRMARDSAGALLSREAGSGAVRHVATSEPA
jgi:hypothetical protein